MTLIRPEGKLIFDNPDCNGRINLRKFGQDWPFEARRQGAALQPGTWVPSWIHDGTEVVPGLDVLTLRGSAPPASMSLDDVTIVQGENYWKRLRPDWQPRTWWLAFIDGNPGQDGFVRSQATVQPRLAFRFVDFLPTATWTGQSATGLNLLGDGSEDHGYSLLLPIYSSEHKFPKLYRGQAGAWTLVDEFDRADAATTLQGKGVRSVEVWVEETDGQLVIRFAGIAEPWVYQPDPGKEPLAGPWEVAFEAHMGLCNVAEIAYPEEATCTAAQYIDIPMDCNPLPGQVISEETYGGPGASVVWLTNGDSQIKPEITLQTGDIHTRPIVRVVHECHEATLTARPMETPIDTQTRATALLGEGKDPAEFVHLRWRRALWRDWTFWATIRDVHDYWSGILKPNMQVALHSGWDGSLVEMMTGYLARPKPIRNQDTGPGQTAVFELECRDYIMARLAEKKYLLESCSPEGWDLAEWADWQLIGAGCGLTTDFPSGTIVQKQLLKEISWRRAATDLLVPALDEVFRAHGWVPLAIDADNVIWSGPEPAYSGTPDFVLDEATATGDNILTGLDVEIEDADHRNAVAGESAAGLVRAFDDTAWTDPDSDHFSGDDSWHGEQRSGSSANALAAWALTEVPRRLQTDQILTWERLAAPASVWPGAYVEVTVEGLGVEAGTVMQVVADEGKFDPQRLTGWGTYVCERIEVPA